MSLIFYLNGIIQCVPFSKLAFIYIQHCVFCQLHGSALNGYNIVYFSILLLTISRQFQILCHYRNAEISTFLRSLYAYV